MIGHLLPPGVRSAEAFGDEPGGARSDGLYPAERALVARAVEARRREFATVRVLARRALAGLGAPPVPLLPGHRGAPRWPDGVVGSMTHCAGYRAAAVARGSEFTGLGVDAEPNAPLPAGVLASIALPGELRALRRLAVLDPSVSWDRLLFSAKEAVYKTWYPVTGCELDFPDADLEIDPAGTLVARLGVRSALLPARLAGRWSAAGGLLVCAVAVPARPAPGRSQTVSGSPARTVAATASNRSTR